MSNERISFNYDPIRQGYDTTMFKTLAGAPSSTGTAVRLNGAEIIGYGDLYKSDVEFSMIIPAVPTTGDLRTFGLKQAAEGSEAVFNITDDGFFCICSDSQSGVSKIEAVTWQAGWEAVATTFQIKWTGFSCQFLVNGKQVAFINDGSIPKVSLSLYADNENSDNMDIKYIEVQNTQGYI